MNLSFGLVKTAADAQGDALLERESRWLHELEDERSLKDQLPRVIEEGTSPAGRRYLVISMWPARGETRAFTAEHARFLANLGKVRFRSIDFEVSGTGEWLQRSLAEARAFAGAAAMRTLEDCYHACETALLYWTGPYVLSQGDFAPWHIRRLDSQLFVTDWGNARAEASPLDDVLHYVMIQRALHGRPVTAKFLQSAMKRAHDFAVLAYPEWTWRPRVIGALTLVYLLGALLHYSLPERRVDRSDPVVKSYFNLIEKRSAWMPGNN